MVGKKQDTLIIIPVYNERLSISNVISLLQNSFQQADILIVDDGSTDNTQGEINRKDVFTITHVFNLGIGSSFQTGCHFAVMHNYHYIVRIDGDGQHDPAFIKDVLDPVKQGKFDIVVGSRFLGESEFKSSFMRIIGIMVISWVLRFLTGKKATDPTSGLCAMNKKAFGFFAAHCVEDYPEPEVLIHHRSFRITEVPINLTRREGGCSSITPLKSAYYMYKVLFSIFLSIFRKE